MYQADRPDQIEKLEASISLELAEEEAADVAEASKPARHQRKQRDKRE